MGAALRFDDTSQRIAIPAPAGYTLLRVFDEDGYALEALPAILLEVGRVFDDVELREITVVAASGDRSGDEYAALQLPDGRVIDSNGTVLPTADAWVAAVKERDRRYAERATARAAQRAAEALV